ncbi:MAG: hypothetical protein ACK46J_09070, partial [Burkholderiales bacterium]
MATGTLPNDNFCLDTIGNISRRYITADSGNLLQLPTFDNDNRIATTVAPGLRAAIRVLLCIPKTVSVKLAKTP